MLNESGSDPGGPEAYIQRLGSDFIFFVTEIFKDRKRQLDAPLGDVEFDIAAYAAGGAYDPEVRAISAGRQTGFLAPGSPGFLARAAGAVGRFRGVLAPRGIGKTHLITASLALWRLFRDTERKVLIVSKSQPEAKKTVLLIRQWIEAVWFLRHLSPRKDQRDNRDMFDVGPAREHRQASVTAIGIEGQLEGNRAHTVIPDDIETDKNTETLEAREALDRRVGEFKDILYGELPGGATKSDPIEIVYVGTYHHEESVYLKLANRGYAFRTWCLAYPAPDQKLLSLAPMLADRLAKGAEPGTSCLPHRYDMFYIASRAAEGPRRFGMQHMLLSDLGARNRYPLQLADLVVHDADRDRAPVKLVYGRTGPFGSTGCADIPALGFGTDKLYRPIFIDQHWSPYGGTKAWIDPAGRGTDRTGFAAVAHLAGLLWLKCSRGLPGGASSERMKEIVRLLRDHGVRDCYVETNNDVFDTYFPLLELTARRHFLEPGANDAYPEGWKCSFERRHSTGQKEVRIIEALEPVMGAHRLVVSPSAITPEPDEPLEHTLQYQLTRITRQRKCLKEDGRVDALAGVIAEWQYVLSLDPEKAAQRNKDEFDLMESLGLKSLPDANWLGPQKATRRH